MPINMRPGLRRAPCSTVGGEDSPIQMQALWLVPDDVFHKDPCAPRFDKPHVAMCCFLFEHFQTIGVLFGWFAYKTEAIPGLDGVCKPFARETQLVFAKSPPMLDRTRTEQSASPKVASLPTEKRLRCPMAPPPGPRCRGASVPRWIGSRGAMFRP